MSHCSSSNDIRDSSLTFDNVNHLPSNSEHYESSEINDHTRSSDTNKLQNAKENGNSKKSNQRFVCVGKVALGITILLIIVLIILFLVFGIPVVPQYKIVAATPSIQDSSFIYKNDVLTLSTQINVIIQVDNVNKFDLGVDPLYVNITLEDQNVKVGEGSTSAWIPKSQTYSFTLPLPLFLTQDLNNNNSGTLTSLMNSCGYGDLFQKMLPTFKALGRLTSEEKGIYQDMADYLSNPISSTLQATGLQPKLNSLQSDRRQQLLSILTPNQQNQMNTGIPNLFKRQLPNPFSTANNDPFGQIQSYWKSQIDSLKPKTIKQVPIDIGVDLTIVVIVHYTLHPRAVINIQCPDNALQSAFYQFASNITSKIQVS